MISALFNSLLEWNRTTNEREKLQHVYVTVSVLVVVIAGIVGLINEQTGRDLLRIAMAGGAIFLINAVLWSLIDSMVVSRLSGRRKKQ